jgi:PEP-CTERM motif
MIKPFSLYSARLTAIAFGIIALTSVRAIATPIEFILSGVGAGELNKVDFTTSSFVITSFGDTDNRIVGSNYYQILHGSSSININGIGTVQILTQTSTAVNSGNQIIYGDVETNLGLVYGPFTTQFNSWDMTTGIGPISASGGIGEWISSPVLTNDGSLDFFDSINTITLTFQAILVPEPSTLALLALGLIALLLARRRLTIRLGF